MARYAVRVEVADHAVGLEHEVDGQIDKFDLEKRAQAMLQEQTGVYSSGNEYTNPTVTVECNCGSASPTASQHKRECAYRVVMAVKENAADQI